MSDAKTTDVLQQVHDYLLQVYSAGRTGSTRQQLAFEPIGVPLSADMFRVNSTDAALSPAMAIEQLADLSNVSPEVNGGTFLRGLRTLEASYEVMLYGATPLVASDAGFAHIKSEAERTFGDPLGSLQPAGAPYRAVQATPTDWYDATHEQNWTSHTFAESTGPPPETPPPPSPPLDWHVVPIELSPVLLQRQNFFTVHDDLMRPPPPDTGNAVRPMVRPMMMMRAVSADTETVAPQPIASSVAVRVAPELQAESAAVRPEFQIVRPVAAAMSVAAIASQTTPQQVSGSGVSVTFEYCMVLVKRGWLSDAFLELRNWYLPGYHAGDLSSGSDAAGSGNFSLVPTAFIAIKNLAIKANWSDEDKTALNTSAALGPFALFGRTFDAGTNTLTCPGMQLVAWVCETQPQLPPSGDPTVGTTKTP